MNISKHIKNWAKITLKESCDRLEETNYPCTDGFPQSEKDICDCPECGEKMYESEEKSGITQYFEDFFQNENGVQVTESDGITYISLNNDDGSYTDSDFEQLKRDVRSEADECGKYEHGSVNVEIDTEKPYTIKVSSSSGIYENFNVDGGSVYMSDEQIPDLMIKESNDDFIYVNADDFVKEVENEVRLMKQSEKNENILVKVDKNRVVVQGRYGFANIPMDKFDSATDADFILENEDSEEPVTKQDEMTLREFFEKAKRENGELQVHFIKVTDKQERTVIFSNSANVGASFEDSKSISPRVLKTITKNHDRVYEQNVTYTGSLVTFPEKITEQTPHVTKVQDAGDGTQWQWRRLYIQQIIDVKYNGKVVWENNGLFNFNLAGKDGKVRTTVSKAETDQIEQNRRNWEQAYERRNAEYKALRKQAVEIAKTLSEEDCSVDLGYSACNGFDYMSNENKIKVLAIKIKHEELCRTNPTKHAMRDTSRNPMRGDHSEHCKGCKFGISWDSSD